MKKQLTAALLAATVALAPLTATADAWQNQANSELSFLPQGQVSAGVAGEVQGESLARALRIYYPLRAIVAAYSGWDMVGWELGRMIAVNDGLPDPGPNPNARGIQRMIYYIIQNN